MTAKAANRWLAYTRKDIEQSPVLVFYETTQACDLACTHCRACAQTRANPCELSTEESQQLIDQLAEFPKPPLLVLTGGDPLKRPDIYELIDHAKQRELDVSITPAATELATEGAIRRLRDAGISRLAVSLDGADATMHDGLRCVTGSYRRTLEILRSARQLGLPTQVNTVVTTENWHQIDAMAELLAHEGIVLWSVFFVVPVGRAAENYCLSGIETEAAFTRLWAQSQRQSYLIKTTEAPHYRRFVRQQLKSSASDDGRRQRADHAVPTGLNDGKGIMFVSHTGMIHPSGFMPIVCGMFPFEHVVRVYQDSPIFRGLRDADRLEGKCLACEYRNLCGGSRARAYAATGNPFAQEPTCIYSPRGYEEPAAARSNT
ncbi:MAG: TIGR04053 family radical SAM/SPASM domain-containing protein [Pirellulaceae bacterium]